jgi:hypothetical protein
MSYAKVLGMALVGLAGHLVEVEADLAAGLPGLTLTGLPDAALSEARDRVRAALVFPVKSSCSRLPSLATMRRSLARPSVSA